ncbi:VWA domain-containing protein [Desulfovibrio sp.]|uniref:cobaltochelatase CobT-related protein n=1 Tax=Desulfovibrio sp. TaxID=885 RepID=UPI0023BFB732|nr:VWA domain-containing protein [Desulfovibrio sp.]MDE7241019.1 VWA domain-containing protein [Desulfovibrio sp.]
MIQNKDVINCLPLLASVLGDRYGVQVQIGGYEACTDGKIIRIPALPVDCDKTALALVKGYIDHESAHIRHSDFGVIRQAGLDKSTHYLFNAIEDWRVERRISAIYPGCRQNLNWLIRRFFVEEEDARAGEKSPALGVLSYVLLTVRSWDVAEVNGPRTRTRAQVEKAYPGLAEKLDVVLDRVRLDCPDTAAALEAAKELVEIIRAFQPEEPAKEQQGGGGQKQNGKEQGGHQAPTASDSKSEGPEKESMQDQPPSASASAGVDDGSDSATKAEMAGGSDFDGEAHENSATETAEGGDDAGDGVNGAVDLGAFLDTLEEDSLPRNLGERIAVELSGAGASVSAEGNIEVATPGFRVVTELAPEAVERALRCSVALRKRLQGLLQANEFRHVAMGRRGKLDDHKLYRLSTTNPRIFRREDKQPGRNSAVHVLLDCSGSMSGVPIQLARQCCYAVAKALEPIKGVNAAVTAFPAITDRGEDGVKPLVRHGEKVSNQFGVEGIGGTPLAPALWWVMQNLYAQKEERKIVIIITDGRPDNVPACHAALSKMRALGMEVYGIGIRLPLILTLLPRTSKVIFDLSELAPAVFGLLQAALLKGGVR